MASLAPAQTNAGRRRSLTGRARHPAEGWDAVGLHLVIVIAAAWAVQRAEWADGLGFLPLAAAGGLLLGLALAKTAIIDLFAHTLAVLVGGAAVSVQTVFMFPELGGTPRDRLRDLGERGRSWFEQIWRGERADDPYLFIILMGMMIWLVAYMSGWTLYRRRWLLAATLLPGFVILINLGYAPDAGSAPLLIYLIAAGMLAARYYGFRRQQDWARSRIPAPPRLGWRFLSAGGNIALLATLLAWMVPLSSVSELMDPVWERLEQPWEAIEQQWDRWLDRFDDSDRPDAGTYAAFTDAFDLGGPLDLSDEPAVLLQTDDPAYLAAQRYDTYSGSGWASDVEETFDSVAPDGRRYSPEMTFRPEQAVLLSPRVTAARVETEGTVRILAPKADLLFTTDTYQSSDIATSVRMSWRQLADEPFAVWSDDLSEVPPDLRRLLLLLREVEFAPRAGDVAPPPALDPTVQAELDEERELLRNRFLETTWTVDDAGRADTLVVSGQVPVYDDVEAVFASDPVAIGETYAFSGMTSLANPNQLRGAGTDYPPYVVDRYLPLPDTVTDRTAALAQELAAPYGNPFDIALAVQNDLRQRISYNEEIAFPPSGQDVVDYVLFESQEGYCEYYASAMVVLLRAVDIPARIVVGYFPAPYDLSQDGFLYRERNAHAWVEVYFPGYGWIPFEPTAAREPFDYGANGPEPQVQQPETTPATPPPVPTATPPPPEAATPPPPVDQPPPALAARDDDDTGPSRLVLIAALAVLGVLVAAAAVAGIWLMSFRRLTPASGFYARLLRVGRWLGIGNDPTLTPAEYAAAVSRRLPAASDPAHRVTAAYTAERYRAAPSPVLAGDGDAAWRQLRRIILRSGWRRGRTQR